MKTFREWLLSEMPLSRYGSDFHRGPEGEEGFRVRPNGERDLGNQIYRGRGHDDPISGHFSRRDKALITHPRTSRVIEERLARSGFRFNILFIEHLLHMNYDVQVEDYMQEHGIEKEGHITFVKNGTSGHLITPWIVFHTIGHAIADSLGGVSDSLGNFGKKKVFRLLGEISSRLTGEDCSTGIGVGMDPCATALSGVLAFKSANRESPYSAFLNPSEIYHELIAEFLWNGDRIRIKAPHDKDEFIVGNIREIEAEIRMALEHCVGRVIYDYFE